MTTCPAGPDPLQAVRDAVRGHIRASGRPQRHDVETCLDISSRHVGVALWASELERLWRDNDAAGKPPLLGLEHPLLVTATPTLLFASAVTALDQCVAAAAFWQAPSAVYGTHKNGNWYSTGDLFKAKRVPTPFAAPPWFDLWFDTLVQDPAWDLTKPFRNSQLHRIQPRSATVSPGSPVVEQFGATITPGGRDVHQQYNAVSQFTLTHWTSFWRHF